MEIEYIKENGIHNLVKHGTLYAYVKIIDRNGQYYAQSPCYHGTNTDKQGYRECFGGFGISEKAIRAVASWSSKAVATKRFNEQINNES